jgi:hypothetical protein
MEIDITTYSGRTTDTRYHNDLIFTHAQFFDGVQQAVEHHAMTASGTPQVWEKSLPQIIFNGHVSNPLSLD